MLGNWCQHALINPAKPRSNFGLTVNCLNSFDNRRTFNDGYHIVHHSNSKLHWTEMPQRFLDTMDKHREEDAWAFVRPLPPRPPPRPALPRGPQGRHGVGRRG